MPDTQTKRQRQSQDAFVILTCPQCGTSTKAMKDDPPTLPDECTVCIERQTQTQVDDLDAGQPQGTTQRDLATMQGNIAKLQGEQRKISAELTALRGDMADMRRILQQVTGTSATKGRKGKG